MVPQSYEKLLQSANSFSPHVRYTAVVNRDGEIIEGGYLEGVIQLYSEKQLAEKMILVSLRNDSRYRDTPIVGSPMASFVEYEKIKRFLINLPDGTMLVASTEIKENTNDFLEYLKKISLDFFNCF
jgi:hypothetical protein